MNDAGAARVPPTLDSERMAWMTLVFQALRVYRGFPNMGGIEGRIHWAAYLAAEIAAQEEIAEIFGFRLADKLSDAPPRTPAPLSPDHTDRP